MESQDEQAESMEEEEEEEEDADGADSNEAESQDAGEEPETSEKENPVDMTGLKMEDPGSRSQEDVEQDRKARIKEIVSNDVAKRKAQELRKHHSRRSTRSAGRPKGSKANLV